MLGNSADAFMTTPMKTSVTTQPSLHTTATEMPAPRATSSFLPGLGEGEMLPGMGDMLPGMGGDGKILGMSMTTLALAGVAAYFLFLRR
jgi:hypothetical protein